MLHAYTRANVRLGIRPQQAGSDLPTLLQTGSRPILSTPAHHVEIRFSAHTARASLCDEHADTRSTLSAPLPLVDGLATPGLSGLTASRGLASHAFADAFLPEE